MRELIGPERKRVFGIACDLADCDDAGPTAADPLYGDLCETRRGLASQSALSRFENGVSRATLLRIGRTLTTAAIGAERRRHGDPKRIAIDPDGTVDPTNGAKKYRLFSGCYDTWCYLPMLGVI